MNVISRGDFLKSVGASAAMAALGCVGGRPSYSVPSDKLIWAALLHVGKNMWDDFMIDPDEGARSLEEEKTKPYPMGVGGKISRYRNYTRVNDRCWREELDHMKALGFNLVFIDLGEALAYPSHPELAVPGTWSVEKMRGELDYIRSLGMEPIPKLNFSACHDSWLKNYHRMLSTRKYYEVVADVIRDAIEVFDRPRFFHIGYDEEMPAAEFNHFHVTVRQGDLWWHDLNYTIGQVEKSGARAVMWADKMWTGRDEFLKRMTKSVLLQNWYYRTDFSAKKMKWNFDFEKKGGWGETVHGAASFKVLNDAGFDQLPCTSNYFDVGSADAVLEYCKRELDPKLLKGYCTAPWFSTMPTSFDKDGKMIGGHGKVMESLDLLKAARDRHYPNV